LALVALNVGTQGGRQGRPSFCEQKEAKKLQDGASRWGWRLRPLHPTGVARRMKFFARFFSKKRCLLADTCTVMTVRTRRGPDQQAIR
jgi:hypothetical protein